MSITIEDIASVCYDVNKSICEAYGDYSHPAWDDAADWQRETNIEGVKTIIKKPSITPSLLHEAWCQKKRADGWVYGPVKDAQAKTHPCLVNYSDLPVEQRLKDHVFREIALSLLSLALRESLDS